MLGSGIACFPFSKKPPVKGVVYGVSCRVDAKRFKQCKGVAESYRMKTFNKVVDETYEIKPVRLHFDLE